MCASWCRGQQVVAGEFGRDALRRRSRRFRNAVSRRGHHPGVRPRGGHAAITRSSRGRFTQLLVLRGWMSEGRTGVLIIVRGRVQQRKIDAPSLQRLPRRIFFTQPDFAVVKRRSSGWSDSAKIQTFRPSG